MTATREPVIGIDLGTTWSTVATVENGVPRIVPNRAGHRLTPSMVGFTRSGERVVGERARLLLEERPEWVAFATKRFLGRRHSQELVEEAAKAVPYAVVAGSSGEVRVRIGDRTLPLPQIAAMILGELKLDAEAFFGRPVTKAVITVPANFDDAQRQATKEAAAIAGLSVLRLVNEPTAAAVAYGVTQKMTGRVLVFDLGGGTFDVSVLEVQKDVFEVRATGGEPYLGGEDFDHLIVQWLLAQVPEADREAVAQDRLSLQRLKIAAEAAKRKLTHHAEAAIFVEGLGDHGGSGKRQVSLDTLLTREFFNRLCDPLTRRCLAVCEQVLNYAGTSPAEIEGVLLVGGMTRVPIIRTLVEDFFRKTPTSGVNPDEAVALGAAIHAHELAEKGGAALLLDVASHSLGVGVLGGRVRRVVEKNTAIPLVAKEIFLPGHANQTGARIPIFQGEAETQAANTKLGELYLKDLRVESRAETPLEVTFELSAEGTLTVRAVDLGSGLAEAVRIEARTEMQKPELERLKREETEYLKARADQDAAATTESFQTLLQRGEEFARALRKSVQEDPGAEAVAAAAALEQLLVDARAALEARDAGRMTETGKKLRLLTARK